MNHSILRFACLTILATCLGSKLLYAQQTPAPASTAMPTVITMPPEAQPSAHFDVEAATRAYLAKIPP